MKIAGIISIVIGALATLYGVFALMMAFGDYTGETTGLGPYPSEEQSVFISTGEGDSSEAYTDFEQKRAELVNSHKTRAWILTGVGAVVLAAGVIMFVKRRKA